MFNKLKSFLGQINIVIGSGAIINGNGNQMFLLKSTNQYKQFYKNRILLLLSITAYVYLMFFISNLIMESEDKLFMLTSFFIATCTSALIWLLKDNIYIDEYKENRYVAIPMISFVIWSIIVFLLWAQNEITAISFVIASILAIAGEIYRYKKLN